MSDLARDLARLCARNRDGSHETQAARREILDLCAYELQQLGFRGLRAHTLKPKHVDALINNWTSAQRKKFNRTYRHGVNKPWAVKQPLSTATIKNRMAHLRWLAEKLNKPQLVGPDNAHHGIPNRVHIPTISKARELDDAKLNRLTAEAEDLRKSVSELAETDHARVRAEDRATQLDFIAMSLRLTAAFGLRREESLKLVPSWAAQDPAGRPVAPEDATQLWLKASWCKGGRERRIPIRTDEQRRALADALKLTGPDKALIPQHLPEGRRFIVQRNAFDAACRRVGLNGAHALRHRFAQAEFARLTGWEAPVNGGPSPATMSPLDRSTELRARREVSRLLGHERIQVTSAYLGGRGAQGRTPTS